MKQMHLMVIQTQRTAFQCCTVILSRKNISSKGVIQILSATNLLYCESDLTKM